MTYVAQTFSVGQVLTASQMNQVETNIKDHIHGDGTTGGKMTSILVGASLPTTGDGTLHVHAASAGTVTAPTNSKLIVENSTNAYLSFLTPNTSVGGFLFGDPDDNDNGFLIYNHSISAFQMAANGSANDQLRLYGSGLLVLPGSVTPPSSADAKLHIYGGDSGGAAFSAADLVVEDGTGNNAWFAFLTTNAQSAGIAFGDPENNEIGNIVYTHSTNTLSFKVGGTDTLAITNGRISGSSATSGETIFYSTASNTGSSGNQRNYYGTNAGSAGHGVLIEMTHASYAGLGMFYGNADRSANSAFRFATMTAAGDTEFNLRGDGNAYADGTWNNSGADFAEYMESADGDIIPVGSSVVLIDGKIRAATDADPGNVILGVVRPKADGKASMVIGNTAWNHWSGKYLTDEFGVYLREDAETVAWEVPAVEEVTSDKGHVLIKGRAAVYHSYYLSPPHLRNIPDDLAIPENAVYGEESVRKRSPDYDPDASYTPREERPEWHIIGMLGQIELLASTPKGDRWVKMKELGNGIERWLVRS